VKISAVAVAYSQDACVLCERCEKFKQEAQLSQGNIATAAHVYLGWLTDRAMHRKPQNRRCTTPL